MNKLSNNKNKLWKYSEKYENDMIKLHKIMIDKILYSQIISIFFAPEIRAFIAEGKNRGRIHKHGKLAK
jgi:hypothetical protein